MTGRVARAARHDPASEWQAAPSRKREQGAKLRSGHPKERREEGQARASSGSYSVGPWSSVVAGSGSSS
eukprot:COSAG02_NODE_481_length_21461_cov_43.885597_2_plen_69_part_00